MDSAPWVMMTSLGRLALDLGRLAIAVAIWATDESWTDRVSEGLIGKDREGTHGHALGLGVRRRLGLIPDQDIDIVQELIQLHLEELRNERRAQVERDNLAVSGGGLGDLDGGLDAVGEEEATDVEELGVVDVGLDFGLGEVRGGELFGRSEGGDEGAAEALANRDAATGDWNSPIVSGQNDGTSARLVILDNLIRTDDAFLLIGLMQLLRELVLADGADVDDVVGGQDVRGCSCGVLCGSAGDVGNLVVLDDVVVAASHQPSCTLT